MAVPLSPFRTHGDLVFLSGHVPVDVTTGKVPADFENQTRMAFENLSRSLNAAGSAPDKVLSVTTYVAAREDIAVFNKLYTEVFSEPYPARAVLVAGLPDARYRVEIQAIAYR